MEWLGSVFDLQVVKLRIYKMTGLLKKFAHDNCGATAIEYALIATFIGVAIIAAVGATGNSLKDTFNNVNNGF